MAETHNEATRQARRYSDMVLAMWENVKYYSTELKRDLNENRKNRAARENPSALAASLSELWEELYPLTRHTEIEKEYDHYEQWALMPQELQFNIPVMFKMKRVLRRALENTRLTQAVEGKP